MAIGTLVENIDPNCICRGNWRKLVAEYEPFLGKQYKSFHGDVYTFFGLVHASDDYYFGMSEDCTKKVILLSCVGDIEAFDFTLIENGEE
jgi:hypothetical protein